MGGQEGDKKTIDKYKEDYYYFTKKASEVCRTLSLGGIAVVWIFKSTSNGNITIPNTLIAPLVFLVVALTLDLLQYISGGLIWAIFYRYKEYQIKKKIITSNSDIKAPSILPNIIHFFYFAKLLFLIIAYCLLLSFLYTMLISSK